MSVRRLAAAEVQPESFAFSKESEKKVAFWMNKYPADRKASAVIPLLWLAQKQEGWSLRAGPARDRGALRDALYPRLRGRDLLHHVQPRAGGRAPDRYAARRRAGCAGQMTSRRCAKAASARRAAAMSAPMASSLGRGGVPWGLLQRAHGPDRQQGRRLLL